MTKKFHLSVKYEVKVLKKLNIFRKFEEFFSKNPEKCLKSAILSLNFGQSKRYQKGTGTLAKNFRTTDLQKVPIWYLLVPSGSTDSD